MSNNFHFRRATPYPREAQDPRLLEHIREDLGGDDGLAAEEIDAHERSPPEHLDALELYGSLVLVVA